MTRLLMLLMLMLSFGRVAESAGYSTWWEDPAGWIYASSVTPMDYRMSQHKVRAKVRLTSPKGTSILKDTFYKTTTATADARLFVDWFYMSSWVGTWYYSGEFGEVYCPFGGAAYAGRTATSFNRSMKLMSSATCVTLVSGSCRPAPGGKYCGYVPIDPCDVKCRADYYTIWVIGSDTIPAPRGFMVKPWLLYPNGGYKCLKGVPALSPNPCQKCWDVDV